MHGQPVLIVYVDAAFATNLAVDLAWLWATAAIAGLRPRWWRLALAALIGAGAGVWAYFPTGRWLATWPGMLGGSALLLAVVLAPCPWRQAVRAILGFALTGASAAGLMVVAATRGSVLATRLAAPAVLVFAGWGLAVAGGRAVYVALKERAAMARGLYRLQVSIGGEMVEVPALLDTGNSLADPLSGTPVVVVERDALAALLPPGLVSAAASGGWTGLDRLPPDWAARCRLVPFQAVGRADGMLLALAPDALALCPPGPGAQWLAVRGLVGLSGVKLHREGAYRALLGPALLEGANPRESRQERQDETG